MSSLRIVSLVPSLTELVCWLGMPQALAGRTRFCTEPADIVSSIPIVGGTKNPNVERIIGIGPDLVLANREENRKEDVEALEAAGLPVFVTDPNSVPDAIGMVRELGTMLDQAERAEELAMATEAALDLRLPSNRVRLFVPIWKDPWMGLGSHSYGHDLIERAGATNVLGKRPRYPGVTLEELAALRPELILLPDEPYPFKEQHVAELAAFAPARIVDGKLLWWYGPRMPGALRELRELFANIT